MHSGRIVFSQILDFMPKYEFNKCVQRYQGNYRIRRFSCYHQFLCMAFAQLTYRESLRDIETCLRALPQKLYHVGLRNPIARSTLAEANENRDWRIYADFAQIFIQQARRLYAQEDFGVTLKQTAYAFDSTTVDLCLYLFPWAQFRRHKAAIKMHTLLDLRGNIPCFIRVTSGKVHDVRMLDELPLEPGSFYIMDRGYTDFRRLATFPRTRLFSLSGPNPISIMPAARLDPSKKARAFGATKPLSWWDPRPPPCTRILCEGSPISIPRIKNVWYS